MRLRAFTGSVVMVVMLATRAAHAGTGIELGALLDLGNESSLSLVGVRSGPVRSGHPGLELAFSASFTSPIVLLADLDLAVPFGPQEGPTFLARGGVSGLTGSLIGVAGFNVGVGMIQPLRPGLGLRGDVIRRFYQSEGDSFGITALTIGLVWGQ